MSAELLRQAAVAMRTDANREAILRDGDNYWETEASLFERRMTPDVALTVAEWLDVTAYRFEEVIDTFPEGSAAGKAMARENVQGLYAAEDVARAYLGRTA